MLRWLVLALAVAACYRTPDSECGIACVQTCPGAMTCTNGRCVSSACPAPDGPPVPIAFVQIANTTMSGLYMTAAVIVKNQRAHDLLVVVVGWNSTAGTVTSVVDVLGTTYHLASDKLSSPTFNSQALYYAYDVPEAAMNTVTVTYSAPALDVDVRVVEYAGIATVDPLDGVAAGQGVTMTSTSGPLVTTHAHDLIVAANCVHNVTTGPGTGFATRQIDNFSDITEDQIVFTAGTHTATAPLNSADDWVMQAAAFKGD
jgi:hypothetical protein